MFKKMFLVILLLLTFTVVASADPYGFTRMELERNDWLMKDKLLFGDNIDPNLVEQIIWSRSTGAVITNTFSRDVYVFYFNQPGEIGSFCVGAQNGDSAYVAFVKDDPATTLGIKVVINGGIEVRFFDGMTFADMFNAVRAALQSVCAYPVHDSWVFMVLKMLLELMRITFP